MQVEETSRQLERKLSQYRKLKAKGFNHTQITSKLDLNNTDFTMHTSASKLNVLGWSDANLRKRNISSLPAA